MTALGEAFAVLACMDWRAVMAGLFNLKGRVISPTRQPARTLADQGLGPAIAPMKNERSD